MNDCKCTKIKDFSLFALFLPTTKRSLFKYIFYAALYALIYLLKDREVTGDE